jgi:hypothetical protein
MYVYIFIHILMYSYIHIFIYVFIMYIYCSIYTHNHMLCAIHQAGPRLKKCTYMGTVEEVGPSMQALLDDPLMTHPDVQKAQILFFFPPIFFQEREWHQFFFWCHKTSVDKNLCLPWQGPVNRVLRTCVFVGCKMLRRPCVVTRRRRWLLRQKKKLKK